MAEIIGYDAQMKLRCTCRECTAIVQYVPNEVKTKRVSCMGDMDSIDYIECPSCKADINHVARYKR